MHSTSFGPELCEGAHGRHTAREPQLLSPADESKFAKPPGLRLIHPRLVAVCQSPWADATVGSVPGTLVS